MKPTRDEIRTHCPDVDKQLIDAHLSLLDPAYFEHFSPEQIAQHIQAVARLSRDHPVDVSLPHRDDELIECSIITTDYPFAFSLITGTLAGLGFTILSGDTFTYQKPSQEKRTVAPASSRRSQPSLRRSGALSRFREKHQTVQRRRIVDRFIGELEDGRDRDAFEREIRARLNDVFALLASKEQDAANHAKQKVNELVTQSVVSSDVEADAAFLPVSIEFDTTEDQQTRMRITGQDTPAFLYMLSTAMSLQGLNIERVGIRTLADSVEDEIVFVDRHDKPIESPQTLDRIRFIVLLTKQFGYFLHRAPDPYAALTRFEFLVEEASRDQAATGIERLKEPKAMRKLARLLGASNFLWEDFIRSQYETLLPTLASDEEVESFAQPIESAEERLKASLKDAVGLAEEIDRINAFKDRETFLLDLDQILHPEVDFAEFSRRLTHLAELVVRYTVWYVHNDMVRSHGQPRLKNDAPCHHAAFGLGKLGGAALGYASDIELLFVYEGAGFTAGGKRKSIANSEFFEQLVKEVSRSIRSKREGIFQVDLRLRPDGVSGPNACTVEQFERYYGPDGKAHAAERLALVRLRGIGGDEDLSRRVEQARDRFIYDNDLIDPSDIWDLRVKQYEQKTSARSLNAKYGPGALVDLEYTVQLLQVRHARQVGGLRTPLIRDALEALREGGVIDADEAERLVAAYRYLRRLINGLRMLRGSAKDLELPPLDSDELVHLARRLGYDREGWLGAPRRLLVDFHLHSAAVRAFVERHFGRWNLPDTSVGNVADCVLSEALSKDKATAIFTDLGFADPQQAEANMAALLDYTASRNRLAELAVRVCDTLRYEENPDRGLDEFVRFFIECRDREALLDLLLSRPRLLEVVVSTLSRDDGLSAKLIDQPLPTCRMLDDDSLLRRRDSLDTLRDDMLERLDA